MNILSLPLGADTGGVSRAIGAAFEGVEGWSFRSIISTLNYIDYETDLRWSRETVEQYWQRADVIHLHHNLLGAYKLTKGWRGFHLPAKPYLVHFHGTGYREDPRGHLRDMRRYRATGVAATLDLWLLAPDELTWLPCPVNVGAMQDARKTGAKLAQIRGPATQGHVQEHGRQDRQRSKEEAVIRIAHAPTNRGIKSTDAFLSATEQLIEEGHSIEVDLIEGVSWKECLSRKSSADIYFDQVILGYGNNAIESWGMGIPVIAGAQPATLAEMERRFGSLPFYNSTEATIYDSLKALICSKDLRDEYAARGLEHVQRFHDERVVVEQLKALYQRAAGVKEQVA